MMLTLFCIPKPFHGHVGVIQCNAIQSWLQLQPNSEIVLCGDDDGVLEAAATFNVRHFPDITRNEFGTPILSDAFERVQQIARNPLIGYVNADMILLPDVIRALQSVSLQQYLMVGRRTDLDITAPIDFEQSDWQAALREQAKFEGKVQHFDHIDYFIFNRGLVRNMPAFAVGRPGWDNWFIYNFRAQSIPVIDATAAVTAIHQNHDYAHVLRASGDRWEGPEADHNRALMGGKAHRFYIVDATHKLTNEGKLVEATDNEYLERRASRQAIFTADADPISRFFARAMGWIGRNRAKMPASLWQWVILKLAK
ncbi:MAG: hypothetical protein U0528_11275 [Anaerolineae bacterium]|nr:hypothetical protein [Anaerolineae bacterium]